MVRFDDLICSLFLSSKRSNASESFFIGFSLIRVEPVLNLFIK